MEHRAYIETDKELTDIILLATLVTTPSNITEQVKKAYELGFKRGSRAVAADNDSNSSNVRKKEEEIRICLWMK